MFPAAEVLDARLRGRQTDQVLGHEVVAHEALVRRAELDIPRRRDVDAEDGLLGLDHGLQHGVEGHADGRLEAEAEERVDDQVGRGGELRSEFLGRAEEWDVQMPQLFLQAGEDGRVGGFGVVDLGPVAVVVEMAGADESVASWSQGTMCKKGWILNF